MDERAGRTAIVVVDMVGDMFRQPALAQQRPALVAAINGLTAAGRRYGARVIWIRQEYAPDLSDAPLEYRRRNIRSTIADTPGAELLPELEVAPPDQVVVKKRYSGFFGTDLDDQLRHGQVGQLVLAGVNTHACVRTTAIDAYQRDYDVVLVRDCVGSYDSQHHDVSLRYMDERIGRVVSLQAALADLSQASVPGRAQ